MTLTSLVISVAALKQLLLVGSVGSVLVRRLRLDLLERVLVQFDLLVLDVHDVLHALELAQLSTVEVVGGPCGRENVGLLDGIGGRVLQGEVASAVEQVLLHFVISVF